MRNKPTIIAFKTPSLENAKARKSTSVDMGLSKIFNQKDAEEGVVAQVCEDGECAALCRGIPPPQTKNCV